MWQKQMKTVLMGKQYWTIVSGTEKPPKYSTDESMLESVHRAQNDLSTISIAMNDNLLGAAADKENLCELWKYRKSKYSSA